MNGYWRKILRVDLGRRAISIEEPSEKILQDYLGGSGLAAYYLYRETGRDTDPLGPENRLIFMTGPFAGTRIPCSGRHCVVARSPLTGIWGESDAGGYFGQALKRAGYDGIIIAGIASEPVYLWVSSQGVELRAAKHLWGMDTYEADSRLRAETHERAVVAVIGPAGENMVKIAAVMHDGKHGRAAGRTGLGAVMGSKNLKAIVARGDLQVPVAEPEELVRLNREMILTIRQNSRFLGEYGTAGGIMTLEASGDMPIKNWRLGKWAPAAKLSGEVMRETIFTGSFRCGACVIGCGREVKIEKGRYAGVDGAGPEYETVCSLGTYCLIDDLEAVAMGNELCNRYGLDTISAGAAVAFAMEAYEKGLLTLADTGGVPLEWGDAGAMLELIRQMGVGTGLGKLLGQGVAEAARVLGPAAGELAVHVRGLELPAHDPRAFFSSALAYATSNRGACHLQALSHAMESSVAMPELGYPEIQDRFSIEGKGRLVASMQDLMAVYDSLKICKFVLWGGVKVNHLARWLNLVTGWDWDLQALCVTGERLFNLKRMYNIRCGSAGFADGLPKRILTLPRDQGGAANRLPDLAPMLEEYYRWRNWDETGRPRMDKLMELGLAGVCVDG